MKPLEPMVVSGREVLPLVEGGKGIAVSNGESAGAWVAAGAVGTASAINADSYNRQGDPIKQVYHGKTRRKRQEELIAYAIRGGIAQARIAHETSGGKGPLLMNFLWEAGGTASILQAILEGAKGLVHGIVCGAGMPFRLAEITSSYKVYYFPIISSARAFSVLWKRAYHKYTDWFGGVVYEDPWLAGGHNGLSNSETPDAPQDPFSRVRELRAVMRDIGQGETPIFMAGGLWFLRDWQDWIGNKELGPIAFQFGTRTILTQESPVSEKWKKKLLSLKEGDVLLNRFSPTGFYSSAVSNSFLAELVERNKHQVCFSRRPTNEYIAALPVGARGRPVYLMPDDKARADDWIAKGFTTAMKTPESTLIFVTPEKSTEIFTDQQDCMGCLSSCKFSNWSQNENGSTGKKADPRSFCIQKTLQSIAHDGGLEDNLMFSGHNAYKFATDPFYDNGFIPSVQQLVDRLQTGD